MISVCLATYNGCKYIREQLESILPQLSEDDEIIVSDDVSSDNTVEVIQSLNDQRIVVVKNNGPHGFVKNFENVLKYIHGDFVFFSDQDDIWTPDKVKKSLNYLQKYDLIVHNALLVDANGCSLGKTYFECLHQGCGFWMNWWKNRFLGCCMVMKRNIIEYSLPFPQNTQGHDYWIGMLALAAKYKVGFVDDVLLLYRRHGNNLSPSSEKSNNSLFYKIFTKRLPLLINVLIRRFSKIL